MKLKKILTEVLNADSKIDDEYYQMGYNAFSTNLPDTPSLDPLFKEKIDIIKRNFNGNYKTLLFLISKLQKLWISGYEQASKDYGIKPIRIKGSSQSSASYLLKGHKRRKEKMDKK